MIYLCIYLAICLLIYLSLIVLTKIIDGRVQVKDLCYLIPLSLVPVINIAALIIGLGVAIKQVDAVDDFFNTRIW